MLACDICNGNLVMDGSREFAVCEGCGMKYSKDALRSMLSGTAQAALAPATGEADRLAENGEQFMKLKEYDKAQEVYSQLMKSHPEDWRGWWGLFVIQITTANFSKFDDFVQNEKYAQNAFAVAGTMQGAIRQQYDVLWDDMLRHIEVSLSYELFLVFFSDCTKDGYGYGKVIDKDVFSQTVGQGSTGVSERLNLFWKTAKGNADFVKNQMRLLLNDNSRMYERHVLRGLSAFDFFIGASGNATRDKAQYLDPLILCLNHFFVFCSDRIEIEHVEKTIDYSVISQMLTEHKKVWLERSHEDLCPNCGGKTKRAYCNNCQRPAKPMLEFTGALS